MSLNQMAGVVVAQMVSQPEQGSSNHNSGQHQQPQQQQQPQQSSSSSEERSNSNPNMYKLTAESRACIMCSKMKTKCDFNIRPCPACVHRGMQSQCLADADVPRRACAPCRKAKRNCDKGRPCSRCVRMGKPDLCQSYVSEKRQLALRERLGDSAVAVAVADVIGGVKRSREGGTSAEEDASSSSELHKKACRPVSLKQEIPLGSAPAAAAAAAAGVVNIGTVPVAAAPTGATAVLPMDVKMFSSQFHQPLLQQQQQQQQHVQFITVPQPIHQFIPAASQAITPCVIPQGYQLVYAPIAAPVHTQIPMQILPMFGSSDGGGSGIPTGIPLPPCNPVTTTSFMANGTAVTTTTFQPSASYYHQGPLMTYQQQQQQLQQQPTFQVPTVLSGGFASQGATTVGLLPTN